MKVYVLITGEPDSVIEGVFSTREKAEKVKASQFNPGDNYIEEIELDEYSVLNPDRCVSGPRWITVKA